MNELEELVQQIKVAFGNLPLPPSITIRPFLKEDPYVVELEERFRNKSRERLGIDDISWLITDIIWLSKEALEYFFPKILEITVQDPLSLVNFDLLPMQLSEQKIIEEKFGFITPPQAEVVIEILRYWQRNQELMSKFKVIDEIKKAISYWKAKFGQDPSK